MECDMLEPCIKIGEEKKKKRDTIDIVMDFSNIVHENQTYYIAKLSNYEFVKSEIIRIIPRANLIPIADARTRHKIDEKSKFENKIVKNEIIQAPAGEKADYYILKYAKRHYSSLVISNDLFRGYPNKNGLEKRIIPYKIINNDVIFSEKLNRYLKSLKIIKEM